MSAELKRYDLAVFSGPKEEHYQMLPYVSGEWVKYSDISDYIRDAKRFQWCQDNPREAQAMFWNHSSRKERAKAIDSAIGPLPKEQT